MIVDHQSAYDCDVKKPVQWWYFPNSCYV